MKGKTLFPIMTFGLLCAAAFAQTPQVNETLTRDARLDATISLESADAAIADVLQVLPGANLLKLRANPEAGDERITLYAREIPLRRLMIATAQLMNYPWTAEPNSATPAWYQLERDNVARSVETRLRAKHFDNAVAPLSHLAQMLKLSPDALEERYKKLEKEDRLKTDPLLEANYFYLARPYTRNAVELYGSLSANQRRQLAADETLHLQWKALSPRQQELVHSLAEYIAKDRFNPNVPKAREGEDDFAWVRNFGLLLYAPVHPVRGVAQQFSFGLGGEQYVSGQVPAEFRLTDILPVRGNPYERKTSGEKPVYPALEKRPFPTDFQLDDVKLKTWSEVLGALSKRLEIPLLSDSHLYLAARQERGGSDKPPKLDGLSLPEGLDALCDQYHYLWWYEDGVLFFRSRTWFLERDYAVPASLWKRLQKRLETAGRLAASDLDDLGKLTWKQLQGLNAQSALEADGLSLRLKSPPFYQRLRGDGGDRPSGFLRVYSTLNAAQKEKALAEGLTLGDMSPPQRNTFLLTLARFNFSEIKAPIEATRFRAIQGIEVLDSTSQRVAFLRLRFEGMGSSGIQIAFRPPERRLDTQAGGDR